MPNDNSIPQIDNILSLLKHKTAIGQAVWLNDGEMLTIRLPNVQISLGAVTAQNGETEYCARVALPNGKPVATVNVAPEHPYYSSFQDMYTLAERASWTTLAREIEKSVSEEGMIGTSTTAPPQLPAQPTPDQARSVFERVNGEWHLDYSHGEELVNIDTNGNYFVVALQDGKTVSTTTCPTFRLEVLSCNANFTAVEIAKVLLNGRTRQIEVLNVTTDKMTGYAKHDGHRLVYTRRSWVPIIDR